MTTVIEGNTASRRALEKAGYHTVGIYRRHEFRHNRWWDVWIDEVLREDWLARASKQRLALDPARESGFDAGLEVYGGGRSPLVQVRNLPRPLPCTGW